MNKNKLTKLIALTVISLTFFSCHDDIYSMINSETSIDQKGITGGINSIVQLGNYLYCQNGNLYKRDKNAVKENEQWKRVSSNLITSNNRKCEYLASDDTYLYTMVVEYEQNNDGKNNPSIKYVYFTDNSNDTWTNINLSSLGISNDNSLSSIKIIFDNKSTTGRNAYITAKDSTTNAYHVYKLNGSSTPTLVADNTNNSSSSTISSVKFKGSDYFFSHQASIASDDFIYYSDSNSSKVKRCDGWNSTNGFTLNGSTLESVELSTGSIQSIALTSDYMILGTSTGIAHTEINDDGTISSNLASFNNNAKSALNSSYIIQNVLVLDSALAEGDNTIYATLEKTGSFSSSNALFNEIGLWACYPGNNWNRDGTNDSSTKGN